MTSHDRAPRRTPAEVGEPMTRRSFDTVTGLVVATVRRSNSVNGNPNFDVTIQPTDGEGNPTSSDTRTFRTSSDAMMNYGIENREHKERVHTYGISHAGRLDGYCSEGTTL